MTDKIKRWLQHNIELEAEMTGCEISKEDTRAGLIRDIISVIVVLGLAIACIFGVRICKELSVVSLFMFFCVAFGLYMIVWKIIALVKFDELYLDERK